MIAINVFAGDSEEELRCVENGCADRGLQFARVSSYSEGGSGAEHRAEIVSTAAASPQPPVRYLYELDETPEAKIAAVARRIYGASDVEFSRQAKSDLARIQCLGYSRLPICIAKTHLSLSSDPACIGHPRDFVLSVESVRIAAGAGYLLALTGDIVTMPGLPRQPAACSIDMITKKQRRKDAVFFLYYGDQTLQQ